MWYEGITVRGYSEGVVLPPAGIAFQTVAKQTMDWIKGNVPETQGGQPSLKVVYPRMRCSVDNCTMHLCYEAHTIQGTVNGAGYQRLLITFFCPHCRAVRQAQFKECPGHCLTCDRSQMCSCSQSMSVDVSALHELALPNESRLLIFNRA